MAIETRKKTIDGHEYTVTSFGGTEGVRIKAVLMRSIGPAIFSIMTSSKEGKFSEAEVDPRVFTYLFNNLDENQYINFILRLLKNTRRDDVEMTREIFDAEFAGEYGTLYKVLLFVLEVNYKKSFFGEGGIGSLLSEIQTSMPQGKNFGKG